MRHSFKKNILLFILITNSLIGLSQSRLIHSIAVNPVQPYSNDSVTIIAVVGSSRTPCKFDSVAVSLIDTNIIVDAYYIAGQGASPCGSQDTIALGQLDPKQYKLKYNAIDRFMIASAIDSIYFTVNQVIGIQERNNPIQSVSVYPNPSGELINLNVQLEKAITTTIRITDTQGKLVYNEEVRLEKGEVLHSISSKKLSSGIYHLSAWNKEQLLNEKKIIVQH